MTLNRLPPRRLLGIFALGLSGAFLSAAVLVNAQMSLPPRMRGPVPSGPDAAQLLRGQKAYVLADCHLCHGATLAEARGGGADLSHSRVVAMDVAGSMIGPVVRAGLPRTQTAMPSYPDMSDKDLNDLVAYIHFMRRTLHEKQALALDPAAPADMAAGRAYFFENCATCHNGRADLQEVAKSSEAAALRAKILRPVPTSDKAAIAAPGRAAHLRLLENYDPTDVANLVAYLRSSRAPLSPAMAKAIIEPPREISMRIEQNCAACHGPGGSGGDRAPPLVNNPDLAALDAAGVKAILANGLPGGMPAFPFTDRELDEYAGWLKAHNRAP